MNVVTFDFETYGELPEYALQPNRVTTGQAWVTAFAASKKASGQWISMGVLRGDGLRPAIEKILSLPEGTVYAGWNVVFDIQWLMAMGYGELIYDKPFLDVMHLYRHATVDSDKSRKYDLKSAVAKYMPEYAGYEEDVDFGAVTEEELAKLLKYNRLDTVFTGILFDLFWGALSDEQKVAVKIESKALTMVAAANLRGIWADRAAADNLIRLMNEKEEAAWKKLEADPTLIELGVDIRSINVNSNAQLSKLLFSTLGIKPLKVSAKTGKASADKESLYELAFTNPVTAELKKVRDAIGTRSKYGEATIASLDYNGDGYVRPQARIFSTYSGRVSYTSTQGKGKGERQTGVALHQWQRGKDVRNIIAAPEGYALVEYDFAGQEYRWMAYFSKDPIMLQMCLEGEDGHSFMGARIAHEDYTQFREHIKLGTAGYSDKRKLGKVANLSCIAEGQLVTTDRGAVPIEQVRLTDKVWDGVEWVSHGGVVFNGVKNVITYDGVTATPDHLVLVNDEWVSLATARSQSGLIRRAGEAPLSGITTKVWTNVYDILDCGTRNRFVVNGRIVHNCQYRTSAPKLLAVARVQYGIDMGIDEAKAIHKMYRTTYAEVPSYWNRAIHMAKQAGYATTAAGRRVQILGRWASGTEQWAMESTAINYKIQGTSADQKYLALAVVKPMLTQMGGHFYYELHDGLFFILPKNPQLEGNLITLGQTLSNLPYKAAWGVDLPIKFPVDGKVGDRWGSMTEIHF